MWVDRGNGPRAAADVDSRDARVLERSGWAGHDAVSVGNPDDGAGRKLVANRPQELISGVPGADEPGRARRRCSGVPIG